VDHLRHFGLVEDPFRDEPRVRDYCETQAAREALLRLERGLRQGRGLGVLTGEPGSGRSMLLRRMLEGLEEEVFESSLLVVLPGASEVGALIARFAKHLGIEAPAAERQALLLQVYEQLAIVREDGRQAVLLVDDADVLGGAVALAELCGLLRLEYEDRRLLSLLLAGSPALDGALASDPSLCQRIDFRARLRGLEPEEADHLLSHRLRRAGGDPALLDPGAYAALHRLGQGLPGRMGRLADNALFEAFLCDRRHVTRADVERAWADLDPGAAAAAAPPEPRRESARREAPPRPPEPKPLHPLASRDGSLGDLDSELEAIFESDEEEAPPRLRRLRAGSDVGLVAQLVED
jgi:general secretion pathway protein A